jgi:hypothetical protein
MLPILSLVLACLPSPPTDQVFKGPGVELRQKVSDRRSVTLELVGADGKTRWRATSDGLFEVTFRNDGKYLATAQTGHVSRVLVFGPDGQQREYDPLELVTEDEKQQMSWTSCGISWYRGLRFKGSTLVVKVAQAPLRPPIYEQDPTPPLEILIDVEAGTMSRRTPPKIETVEALLERFAKAPARRAETLQALGRKAQQEANRGDARLRAFAREQLPKTKEREDQRVLLSILDATGTDEDREWVAKKAVQARWPASSVLDVLRRSRPELGEAYARSILELRLEDVNARAEALRILAPTPDALKYLKLGEEDPKGYVRDAAAMAMRSLAPTEESFAYVANRLGTDEGRLAMVELFVANQGGAPNPFAERFERACDRAMQAKWPGCEAWTAAMADVRGDRAQALARYRHALKRLDAELARAKMRSSEVETWMNVRVRLARLALEDKRPEEAKAHAAALRASKWRDSLRLNCSNGLPRQLATDCDGGLNFNWLMADLEGRPRERPPRR